MSRKSYNMNTTCIWGTVNPHGEQSGSNTLYLTESEILDIVDKNILNNLPVKVEHSGERIGKVVCAWKSQDGLDVLAEIDSSLPGALASTCVKTGKLQDFSLGYNVAVEYSDKARTYRPSHKSFTEVSLVKQGARKSCHVHAFSVNQNTLLDAKVQRYIRDGKVSSLMKAFSSKG